MTQINDPYIMRASITALADNKTYGGEGENLVRTGKGKTGKIANWFKEAFNKSGVRQENQRTLDTLGRQLSAQYGRDSTEAVLRLTGKFASGKKLITGGELKRLANAVESHSFIATGRVPQSILNTLNLMPGNSKPERVLTTIMQHMPQDLPRPLKLDVLAGYVLPQMLNAASENTQQLAASLRTFLFSQEAADIAKLANSPEFKTTIDWGLRPASSLSVDEKQQLREWSEKMDQIKDVLSLTQEAMRMFLPSEHNPLLPPDMPEPKTSIADWTSVSKDTVASLERLGASDFKGLAKNSLDNAVKNNRADSYLRGGGLGIWASRELSHQIMGKSIPAFFDKVKDLFKDAKATGPNQGPSAAIKETFNTPEKRQELQSKVIQAMKTTPGLMDGLHKCVLLMQQTVRPTLEQRNDPQISDKMRSGFNGISWIGGVTAPLSNLSGDETRSVEDKKLVPLVTAFIQNELGEANIKPGMPWGDFLESIPGWKGMVAPLPKDDPDSYFDSMGDPSDLLG